MTPFARAAGEFVCILALLLEARALSHVLRAWVFPNLRGLDGLWWLADLLAGRPFNPSPDYLLDI